MWTTALKWGGIAGLIMGGTLFISLAVIAPTDEGLPDYGLSEMLGWTSMIVSQLVIFLAVWKYRETHGNGAISFGKAFKLGLMVALVASTVYVAFDALYLTVVDPDFGETHKEWTLQQMEAANASQAEIDAMVEQYAMFDNASGVFLMEAVMFVSVFLIGLILSVIAGMLLKRSAPGSDELAGAAA